jgi:predicted metal-dependent hydrolase
VLRGRTVEYRLIRARRRSIGMEVHLDGLTLRAPRWVTLREIEAALLERAAWLVRALEEWHARRRPGHAARVEDRRADPLPRARARARAVPGRATRPSSPTCST